MKIHATAILGTGSWGTALAALCLEVYYRYLPIYESENQYADPVSRGLAAP